jgi:hypothetical protein
MFTESIPGAVLSKSDPGKCVHNVSRIYTKFKSAKTVACCLNKFIARPAKNINFEAITLQLL